MSETSTAEDKAAKIRENTSGKNRIQKKMKVKLPSFGNEPDMEIELRKPSIALIREINILASDKGKNDVAYVMDTEFWTFIRCAYVPGTDERVWNDDSYDDFVALSPGDPLIEAIEEAYKKLVKPIEKEDVKKN